MLERLAAAVDARDAVAAGEALDAARALDFAEFTEAVTLGRETARVSPRRRTVLAEIDRYATSFAQVDYALRDTRVLARVATRGLRSGAEVPESLAEGIRELARSVWSLAAAYDNPDESISAHAHALRAGLAGGRGVARGHGPGPLDRRRPAPRRRSRRRRRGRRDRGADRGAARTLARGT